MSSITVHDTDEQSSERLAADARRRTTSKNALIKEILAEKMGLPGRDGYADDYREVVGMWATEEVQEFGTSQTKNASVDPSD